MTNAEAIEILKGKIHDTVPKAAVGAKKENEAIYMAISALEKQEKKKPLTNADRIRAMSDEELACFIARQRFSVVNQIADKLKIDVTMAFIVGQKNALDWLKQEVFE